MLKAKVGTPQAAEKGVPATVEDEYEDYRAMPVYVELAEILESEILRGAYAPGDRLPTEKALSRERGVNAHTAARALNRLQSKGLVYRVERRGTFVRGGRIGYVLTKKGSFSASISRAGMRPSHEILNVRRVRAYGRMPAEMRVPVGEPLMVFDRVSYANEVPLTYATEHFRERIFPGLGELLGNCPSLRILIQSHYGLEVYRARMAYGMEAADPEVSVRLGVPVGTALLKSENLYVLEDGTPAQWNTTYTRGDALWVSMDLRDVKEVQD